MNISLYPVDEIGIYHTAAEVKSVADEAEKLQQLTSIAKAINTAANTGAYVTRVMGPILPEIITQLETDGYTITAVVEGAAKPTDQFDISWEE